MNMGENERRLLVENERLQDALVAIRAEADVVGDSPYPESYVESLNVIWDTATRALGQ